MGTYVYKTTPKAVMNVETLDGRSLRVQVYRYAYKLYYSGFDAEEKNERMHRRTCGAAERAFERQNVKPLDYGIVVYRNQKPTEGTPVFRTRGLVSPVEPEDSEPVTKVAS